MDDYWSQLPLNIKLNKKNRFNYIMTVISETAEAMGAATVTPTPGTSLGQPDPSEDS